MYEKNLLKGKVALVTGGGTGIGKALALAFARHGADVALAARDGERLEAAAAEIRQATGRKAIGVATDVSDAKAVSALFDKVEAELGPVSILINGAAANFVRPSEMLTSVRFRKVVDIVLHGSFNCAIEAGRRMLPRGEGTIISLLATYAWTGAPGFLPSAAAKAGVQAMTKTLGVEWIGRGVRVNAVCPGLIDTAQSRERLWPEKWMSDALLESVPNGKFGTEEDVANAVLFLCAPDTKYVAGETLVVDAGTSVGGLPYLRFVEKAGVVRKARPK
ncbi:MAG: SDR family oxidoreductase [Elusimicrobia bacterium]|nr:SDR family oxidoreductase [Elusimicrobiota bacterium]